MRLACLLLLVAAAHAGDSLLANGSFEKIGPPSGRIGAWKAAAAPAGWLLNSAYPGTLTVLDDGAAAGKRCIRVVAGAKRDAQMYRPCPGLRPGHWYRISARVRDGSASVLVYEYRTGGGVTAHTLASGTGAAGAWRHMVGFYSPAADGFKSASVALLVPHGKSAVLDNVVVAEMKGPPPGGHAIRLENEEVALVISGLGRLESLVDKTTKRDHADPDAPAPVLSALRDGVRVPVASLTRKRATLIARFADPALVARIRVETRDRYFRFEIVAASPALESLELRFPVKPGRVRDAWMPGTYDDTFGVCHMGVTANTETRLARYGRAVAPEARWYRRHGIAGGQSVLIATRGDRFLATIRQMEVDTGLPSPMLYAGHAGHTGTTEWARQSPALRRSYLFATSLGPDDIDALIRYAKVGGFGMILLHRLAWRASAGHEAIAFPGGLPGLVKACGKIHAAGLGVGLHLFGPFVSLNDAYVTPAPDDRLFTLDAASLAGDVDASATELTLGAVPPLPRRASPAAYPGDLLRVADEIVRWKALEAGPPCRLTGCERGALGTKAAAHAAGEAVRSFVLRNGRILVDPDSTLPGEMGTHLARVVNATRADFVYFDAAGAAPAGHRPERWYYINRTLPASCAKFDHGVLVQTGMGPGRQLAWHLVPRSASADGHGDLKRYLDRRMPGILQMRRTFTAADIGWYALDVHGRPDELEYVCAKALATDSSVSVEAHRALLETHPRAREVFEMIARWERRRLAGDVPADVRKRLLAKGRDFRLLADGSFWEAEYEAERPAGGWTIDNPRGAPVRLALAIRREAMAATPAGHAAADAIDVVDLADPAAFGDRRDARLVRHAQVGDRTIRADGLALRGVQATFGRAKTTPGGRAGVMFGADNTTNGAGWCTTGRKLTEPLDLSEAKAIGFWVEGDGHGETLSLLLVDGNDKRARFDVALDFEGWRFKSFPLRASLDWKRIEYALFELSHIPPHAKVAAGVASVRAVRALHAPGPLDDLTIKLGARTIKLGVALAPGRCVTIDALGRATYWPGGMKKGQPLALEGGPLVLPPGATGLEVGPPTGDLWVRACRTWPLAK